jgi:hypothetical protein
LQWPDDGEIDIMEHVGYDQGRIHASIHSKKYNHVIGTQKTATTLVPDCSENFHVYSLIWTPQKITVLIDDKSYFEFSNEKSDRTAQRVQDIDLYGLPSDFYRNYARRMSSVTPELLQKTANQHLHPENALIIVVGEAKEIRASLESLGKVTVYNTDLNPVP